MGRWRSSRLLVGWSWPALVLVVLGGAWWLRTRPGDGDLPTLAMLLLSAAALGAVVQTLLRIEIGRYFHLPPRQLTVTAIGYRAARGQASAAGNGAQRAMLWGVPTLAILALGLGVALWLSAGGPSGPLWTAWKSPELNGDLQLRGSVRIAAWVWLTQAALMGLPIPGSIGRQVLVGVVERIGGPRTGDRSAADSSALIHRRVDRIQGALAILLAAAAVWQWQHEAVEIAPPAWPFLMALSVLVWSGRGGPEEISAGSGSGGSVSAGGLRRSRPKQRRLSWWGRMRIRRVQRAERGEAIDATRLDAILERLHRDGFDALSAADRSILRRVSQRLRQNRRGVEKDRRGS